MDFRILATDISARVLDEARIAIYDQERNRFHPHGTQDQVFSSQ